jgi:ATP-dependent protease HslVU (ClpYQ) peptidase subunit
MTALAALVGRGRVWIGGDSAVSDSDLGIVTSQGISKVFRVGSLVVACAGACAYEDAWRRATPRAIKGDPDEWVTREVADAVRKAFTGTDVEAAESGALVGFGSRLYLCDALTAPWRTGERYAVMGSGSVPALGVLRSLGQPARQKLLKMSPKDVVIEALECAVHHANGVREPFTIIST